MFDHINETKKRKKKRKPTEKTIVIANRTPGHSLVFYSYQNDSIQHLLLVFDCVLEDERLAIVSFKKLGR